MFWILGFSAFAVFLGIAAIGFLVLLISFFMGELFDFGGHDFDHHVDAGDGVSMMSSRVLSVFVTAFGGFGAIGTHLGYSIGVSTGMGLAGGLVFGGLIYLFASFLYSQQASTDTRISELAGKRGQVSVAIPKGGVGQVRCLLGQTAVDKIARSKDGGEIAAGMMVVVEEATGDTIIVRKAE
jgi:membrane protein implicated in regulation of membrane protease activity